jgi:hypothetical protein
MGLSHDREPLGINQDGARYSNRHGPNRRVADDCLARRNGLGAGENLHAGHLLRIDVDGRLRSRPAGSEILLPHRGDADGTVHVGNVRHVRNIGDVHDIHVGLLNVHLAAFLNV